MEYPTEISTLTNPDTTIREKKQKCGHINSTKKSVQRRKKEHDAVRVPYIYSGGRATLLTPATRAMHMANSEIVFQYTFPPSEFPKGVGCFISRSYTHREHNTAGDVTPCADSRYIAGELKTTYRLRKKNSAHEAHARHRACCGYWVCRVPELRLGSSTNPSIPRALPAFACG